MKENKQTNERRIAELSWNIARENKSLESPPTSHQRICCSMHVNDRIQNFYNGFTLVYNFRLKKTNKKNTEKVYLRWPTVDISKHFQLKWIQIARSVWAR